MIKFEITNDPVEQYAGRGNPGMHDQIFEKLTEQNNCIVFQDFQTMEKVAQALDGWIKRQKLIGAKVKTTKSYKLDKKPRCWLVYPKTVKTEIRGNFPKA